MKLLNRLQTPFWRCLVISGFGFVVQLVATKGLIHIWHTARSAALLQATVLALVAVIVAATGTFYPRHIVPFVRKHTYLLAAAVCCIVFVGLGIFTINQGWHFSKTHGEAITYDELAFLPDGYFYEQNGTYFLTPEHPPLVKDIASLSDGLLKAKQPTPPLTKQVLLQDYAQYYWGKTFLFQSGNNTEAIIFWGRTAVLLANTVLIFLLFLSLAKVWSQRAGFIAVFLLTTSQFVLGHASLVTVDVMSGLFTILTLVWFGQWLHNWHTKQPTRASFWLAAICCAGALLSKFSTILLLPLLVAGAVVYGVAIRRSLRGRGKNYGWSIGGLLAVIMTFVTLFYTWHVRHMASADIIAQLNHSYSKDLPRFGLSLVRATTHFGILGRAFAEFANGILMVNNRIYNGSGSVYFVGHLYGAKGSGPGYFPLLYVTKLQIMYLLLGVGAAGLLIKKAVGTKLRVAYRAVIGHPIPLALGVYAVIFAGIAMMSTLQIGLRHIMPVIMGTMVLVALALDYLIERPLARQKVRTLWAAGVVMLIMIISLLISFPHYLSYYNLLAGGTSNGYKVATDSNYDWGQDLKALAAWQQQHPEAKVYFSLFHNPFLPIEYYLGDDKSYDPSVDASLPSGSYLAVSAHTYEVNVHSSLPANQQFHQFDKNFVARVGTTIFIYKIP